MAKWITTVFWMGLALFPARAATFTLTPNLVSNDYTGQITFQISSLLLGESVQVSQFYDFKGNEVVDNPDVVVRSETAADGQAVLLGGAVNSNVFQDSDGATNGAITASIPFASAPELARGVGTYLFRLSSPSNRFSSITVPFTVVSAPLGQTVQGIVQCSGTNVPYAGVSLVLPSSEGVVFTVADAKGKFTLQPPPGDYVLVAALPGYVMDFQAAPRLTIAAGSTVSTNLTLIPATTSLSGTIVDSDDRTLPVLPNTQITVFSTAQLFTISATDSSANFNVPITPGVWTVRPAWQGAAAKSFLAPEEGSFLEPAFNVTAGPLNGALVPVKRATSLIYGTVQDSHGNPIPGISLSANADGGAFDALATSDEAGTYALAIDAGGGFINVQNLTSPPASGYLWTGQFFNVAEGQSLKLDLTGVIPTATFRGQILDDTGAPVTQFSFYANSARGGTSLGSTDDQGRFSLPVFGGRWQLYPDSGEDTQRGYVFPPYTFQATDGLDLTNNIIVRKATGRIEGYVRDSQGLGLSGLTVTGSATVGADTYNLTAYTDGEGSFGFTVFSGSWQLSLGPYDLLAGGFNPANPLFVSVPPSAIAADFKLVPIGPPGNAPRITNPGLPDALVGQQYEQVLVATNAVRSFSWEITSGTLPHGLVLDDTLGIISGTPTSPGHSSFTVQLTDHRGTNATSTLAIEVQAALPHAPTLDSATWILGNLFQFRVTGAAGEHDTLQMTTTLTNWFDIVTTNAPGQVYDLQDRQATNAMRFYRIKVNP